MVNTMKEKRVKRTRVLRKKLNIKKAIAPRANTIFSRKTSTKKNIIFMTSFTRAEMRKRKGVIIRITSLMKAVISKRLITILIIMRSVFLILPYNQFY